MHDQAIDQPGLLDLRSVPAARDEEELAVGKFLGGRLRLAGVADAVVLAADQESRAAQVLDLGADRVLFGVLHRLEHADAPAAVGKLPLIEADHFTVRMLARAVEDA